MIIKQITNLLDGKRNLSQAGYQGDSSVGGTGLWGGLRVNMPIHYQASEREKPMAQADQPGL